MAPPLVIIAAIVVSWNEVVGVHDLALLVGMYLLGGFGVTVGFHRMLTHRSFGTSSRSGTSSPRSARWPFRARSSTGSPITASTTRTPTRRATRTRRTSARAPASPARSVALYTPMSAGC
ncbi:MAG TPA: hypothetical protein VN751_09900 [Solirubrobacteraceae bacterium]|nr:hypothetical protein [Solirubrobacteraceae bacterium]